MAIEKGRLVVGPTKKRDEERQFYISYLTNSEPGTDRRYVNEEGNVVLDPQLPEVEGQIVVFQKAHGDQYAQAYVAVSIQGTLQWVRVLRTIEIINKSTGKAWDPLDKFYNPLAS